MHELQELRIHADALYTAVNEHPRFFASVRHYVNRLREISSLPNAATSQTELKMLASKLEEFWKKWRSTGDGLYIAPRETADTDPTVRDIGRLIDSLDSMPKEAFAALVGSQQTPDRIVSGGAVFIGHGRSKLWARVQVFLREELELPVITFESESRVGESIVPILEQMLDQSRFAILVLTAEDETAPGGRRARQNVVHEAGLFQGRLGFKRVVLLVQETVEEFTNIAGLQHIRFSGESIEQTFYELRRVLKRERLVS